ncbi:MAG: adenylate/guanylate cyclase domain-containing protein [Acidimicrobiia bacterium]
MQPSPELEAIVRRHLTARRDSDFARVSNLFSQDPAFRAIGTDLDEWIGPEEFRAAVEGDWDALRVADDDIRRLEAFEHGDTGWAAIEVEEYTPSGHSYVYRLTAVFMLEAGVWRIVQGHWSLPVGNEVFEAPELTRTLSDLLDSVDDSTEAATRTATVVFTDVVDSTALSQSMGDAAWSAAIGAHFDRLRAAVTTHRGREVKTLGDGGMYVFDTAGAALATVAVIRAGDDLPIRIGVHTGDLVASGDDVLGATVAKAARVTAAADSGQALVSATTAGIANPAEFSFGPPITLELKGLAGTHVVHELR